jgi:hypothetical protein
MPVWDCADPSPASLRCAAWSRSVGVDPVGSAGGYRGFLLLEIPPPWPRDVADTAEVAALAPLLEGRGLRVQALLGSTGRVVGYLNPLGEDFGGFRLIEAPKGTLSVREAVECVLSSGNAHSDGSVKHLLVCTHGRRDTCCGSLGTRLANALEASGTPPGVRLYRTSHTGGHRFAPTFIVLPEGTLWAYADVSVVKAVLDRAGDFSEVRDHYRGCAGLPTPQSQALEREVLCRVGWSLLDRRRAAYGGPGATTRLVVDGVEAWEAEVTPGRRLPVPDCGRPIEEARKSEVEWVVSGLRLAS